MGETASDTRREVEDTRAEIESKVHRLREAVDSSFQVGDRVRVKTVQAAVAVGIGLLVLPVGIGIVLLRRRGESSKSRRTVVREVEPERGLGQRLAVGAARSAGAAASGILLNRIMGELDQRRDRRSHGAYVGPGRD